MKTLLITALLLAAGNTFAASCPAPHTLSIHGIHLGATFADVQQILPDVKRTDTASGGDIIIPANVDISAVMPELLSITYIALNAADQVESFGVLFSWGEGEMIGEDTPVEEVTARVAEKYGLPATGWQKEALMPEGERKALGYDDRAAQMVLHCSDYRIIIAQDFAVGRQSLGPRMLVMAADSAAAKAE